jgi:hypothetical protein
LSAVRQKLVLSSDEIPKLEPGETDGAFNPPLEPRMIAMLLGFLFDGTNRRLASRILRFAVEYHSNAASGTGD